MSDIQSSNVDHPKEINSKRHERLSRKISGMLGQGSDQSPSMTVTSAEKNDFVTTIISGALISLEQQGILPQRDGIRLMTPGMRRRIGQQYNDARSFMWQAGEIAKDYLQKARASNQQLSRKEEAFIESYIQVCSFYEKIEAYKDKRRLSIIRRNTSELIDKFNKALEELKQFQQVPDLPIGVRETGKSLTIDLAAFDPRTANLSKLDLSKLDTFQFDTSNIDKSKYKYNIPSLPSSNTKESSWLIMAYKCNVHINNPDVYREALTYYTQGLIYKDFNRTDCTPGEYEEFKKAYETATQNLMFEYLQSPQYSEFAKKTGGNQDSTPRDKRKPTQQGIVFKERTREEVLALENAQRVFEEQKSALQRNLALFKDLLNKDSDALQKALRVSELDQATFQTALQQCERDAAASLPENSDPQALYAASGVLGGHEEWVSGIHNQIVGRGKGKL